MPGVRRREHGGSSRREPPTIPRLTNLPVTIESVSAGAVRPLRRSVLRPNQPPEALVYPADDARSTLHAAATADERGIVGIATISCEPHPDDPRPGDWRIRGMATEPDARGHGIGGALLRACLDHARENGGGRVWCNARTTAAGFYTRAGFAVDGGEFELPGLGPHVVMTLSLG